MKNLNVRLVCSFMLMFVFSIISLKVSLDVAKNLTIVLRVFDWDMFKDSDKIGEVIDRNSDRKNTIVAPLGTSTIVEAESLNYN